MLDSSWIPVPPAANRVVEHEYLLYPQDAYVLLIASANPTQVKSEASATSAGMLARPIFSGLVVAP
jgi:hypothetical protein